MATFADQLRGNYVQNQQTDSGSELNKILSDINGKECLVLRKELDSTLVRLLLAKDFLIETVHHESYDCGCDYSKSCRGCHGPYDETTITNLPYKYQKLKEKLLAVSDKQRNYSVNEKFHPIILAWLAKDGISVTERHHEGYSCSCDHGCSNCSKNHPPYTESILNW